ncbi:MAG: hypothetical protein ABIH69_01200 [bacterium]|nr:hypothetical protein [Candidatus Margulisiibacteriota bacterium]
MSLTSMIRARVPVPYLHGLSRLSRNTAVGAEKRGIMFQVRHDGLYSIKARAFDGNQRLLESAWQDEPTAVGFGYSSPDRVIVPDQVKELVENKNLWEEGPVPLSRAAAKALYAQGIRTVFIIKINTKDTLAHVVRKVGRLGLSPENEIVGEKGLIPFNPFVPGYYAHRAGNVLVIDQGETG